MTRPRPKKKDGRKKRTHRRGSLLVLALVLLVFLAIFVPTVLLVENYTEDVEVRTGTVGLEIVGDTCTISAPFITRPDVRTTDQKLSLLFNGTDRPVDLEDGHVSCELNESDFRLLLTNDLVHVKGSLSVKALPLIQKKVEVDRSFDITEIREALSSVKVENISAVFGLTGALFLGFHLTSLTERNVTVKITDAPASVTSKAGAFECQVERLELGIDGNGTGTISIPTLSMISLVLGSLNEEWTIECFGISGRFHLPSVNG